MPTSAVVPSNRQAEGGIWAQVVALDLPTSRQLAAPDNEFTARMFEAINSMMPDMPPGREWRGDLRLRPIEGRLRGKVNASSQKIR
jgi:hypothetical protein